MSTPENPELAGILLAQAQQGQKIAEIDAGLAHVDSRLGELQTVLVGVRGTQAAQGEILDGLAEIKAEVDKVFIPTFGHIARKIPPCWNEHPFCITVLDVLVELHKVLWCQPVRLAGTLSGEAEFLTRLAPAMTDLLAKEREGCEHELAEKEPQQHNGKTVIKYGRPS
jgi:hypothetical protein